MAIDWSGIWQTAIPSLIGAGANIYGASQQQQVGPVSSDSMMSPQERALLEQQLAYSQTVTPLEQQLAMSILPLEQQFKEAAIPLATQQLPQLASLESAQMGAQQQLIPLQTGLQTGQIGAKSGILGGQLPPGFTIGQSYENSPLVTSAINQAAQMGQNQGLLRSGATQAGTMLAGGRVGAELETQKRQEQLGLLGLGLS